MTRYFYTADGQRYLGGYDPAPEMDDAQAAAWLASLIPADAIEIPTPPASGLDTLDPATMQFISNIGGSNV